MQERVFKRHKSIDGIDMRDLHPEESSGSFLKKLSLDLAEAEDIVKGLLESYASRMADYSLNTDVCRTCVKNNHGPFGFCTCYCHKAQAWLKKRRGEAG